MSKYNHADHLLDMYHNVLDAGFVGVKDYFGSDEAIEAAARVSYQSGTRKVSDTRALIRYLTSHEHTSPIEQASITFHLKMPLYVIQQLLRHRTAKINAESHRYSEVSEEQQRTASNKWRLQSSSNKQGSCGYINELFDNMDIRGTGSRLSKEEGWFLDEARKTYEERIRSGVAREQARKDIPVSTYSTLYWTMDIRNLLHFMSLRCDKHAQEEIREYANIIAGFVKEIFPLTFEAWYDYQYCSVKLSKMDRLLLTEYVRCSKMNLINTEIEKIIKETSGKIGMTTREYGEFWGKISPPTEQDFSLDLTKLEKKLC